MEQRKDLPNTGVRTGDKDGMLELALKCRFLTPLHFTFLWPSVFFLLPPSPRLLNSDVILH